MNLELGRTSDGQSVSMPLRFANRHGLITGATGTGKEPRGVEAGDSGRSGYEVRVHLLEMLRIVAVALGDDLRERPVLVGGC